jgi:hypothetical protein
MKVIVADLAFEILHSIFDILRFAVQFLQPVS